jgi:polyisoprenoid-binding protein YceI
MATATQTFSGTYVVDRVHSSLQFAVEHMKLSSFRAAFEDVHGRLAANGGGISIEGSAPVQSISIKAPRELREHVVRGFFVGDDHPEVIFRSTQVELGDDDTATGGQSRTPSVHSGPRSSCGRPSTAAIGASTGRCRCPTAATPSAGRSS